VYGRGKHQFNPLFEDFAKHYGFLIKVCKPYGGIHPKVVIDSIAKNKKEFHKTIDIDSIYIPNRDMQSYDDLIPAIILYGLLPTFSMQTIAGGGLWS
jgi:hypothetical protein